MADVPGSALSHEMGGTPQLPTEVRVLTWLRWQAIVLVVFLAYGGLMWATSSQWRDAHFGVAKVSATVLKVEPLASRMGQNCNRHRYWLAWQRDGKRRAGTMVDCDAPDAKVGDRMTVAVGRGSHPTVYVNGGGFPWTGDILWLVALPLIVMYRKRIYAFFKPKGKRG